METINNRRSVRKYTDQKVEKEKIELLLRAAMQAPSARNQQGWEFLVIEDKEALKALAPYNPFAKCLEGAALGIIVLCNKEGLIVPAKADQDLGAATQNLMLEAASLGLGTCWLGTWPDEDRVEFIAKMFNLPENVYPYAVISIGYPEKEDANKFVDRYDESKIHWGKY